MEVTLLGSGEAVGVPAPLCGCRYCGARATRRRPGLLIEAGETSVVLDASPDIKGHLHRTAATDVDAFFLTHSHFDHAGGVHELNHAAMGFDRHVGIEGRHLPSETFEEAEKPSGPEFGVYLTETALGHITDADPHLTGALDFRPLCHGGPLSVGAVRIRPFPVCHARPQFDTLGFAVHHDGAKVVYAPDMRAFINDEAYRNADLLFVEGSALFRAFGHGTESDLESAIRRADADRAALNGIDVGDELHGDENVGGFMDRAKRYLERLRQRETEGLDIDGDDLVHPTLASGPLGWSGVVTDITALSSVVGVKKPPSHLATANTRRLRTA